MTTSLCVRFNGEGEAGFSTTKAHVFPNRPQAPNSYLYVWNYSTIDIYNPHIERSGNMKVDYRLSSNTEFTFNTIANDTITKFRRRYQMRAFATQQVSRTGNAGILPGYTDRITQVRAAPASIIDMTTVASCNVYQRRNADFGVEHEFGRLQIDVFFSGLLVAVRFKCRKRPISSPSSTTVSVTSGNRALNVDRCGRHAACETGIPPPLRFGVMPRPCRIPVQMALFGRTSG